MSHGLRLDGVCSMAVRVGSLFGSPCYPCAIVVWSAVMLPMRMYRQRPDDADRSAGASKKPASLRRLAV